jgi:hypothetical protein
VGLSGGRPSLGTALHDNNGADLALTFCSARVSLSRSWLSLCLRHARPLLLAFCGRPTCLSDVWCGACSGRRVTVGRLQSSCSCRGADRGRGVSTVCVCSESVVCPLLCCCMYVAAQDKVCYCSGCISLLYALPFSFSLQSLRRPVELLLAAPMHARCRVRGGQ